MQSAEASGKTVDDALRGALAKLGASREEVEFVVLDEGRRGGLFGRGSREATVRVDRIGGETDANPRPVPQPGSERTQPAPVSAPRAPRSERDRGPRPQGGGGGGRNASAGSRRDGFDQPVPKLTEGDFMRPGGGQAARGAESLQPSIHVGDEHQGRVSSATSPDARPPWCRPSLLPGISDRAGRPRDDRRFRGASRPTGGQ